jgi:membrane protein DedA with SNARE-associated domain
MSARAQHSLFAGRFAAIGYVLGSNIEHSFWHTALRAMLVYAVTAFIVQGAQMWLASQESA